MESILIKLFQRVPTSSMPKEMILALLSFGVLLILLYILTKFIKRKTKNKLIKKTIRELPTGLLIFGIIDLLLILFRLENVPRFSMRIWWLVYWIAFIVWVALKLKKILEIKRKFDRATKK